MEDQGQAHPHPQGQHLPPLSSTPENLPLNFSQVVSSTTPVSEMSQDVQTTDRHVSSHNMTSPIIHHPDTTLHSPERQFVCPQCFKPFKSKQQLAQHNLVHSGLRKYTCTFCDKSFKQLCHLHQHTRIHTGEKPYRCRLDGCERSFAQLSNLQHHMRNHEEQVKKASSRQYNCVVCHRSYTNESSLKSHALKMHVHIKPLDARQDRGTLIHSKQGRNKNIDVSTLSPQTSSSDDSTMCDNHSQLLQDKRTRTSIRQDTSDGDLTLVIADPQNMSLNKSSLDSHKANPVSHGSGYMLYSQPTYSFVTPSGNMYPNHSSNHPCSPPSSSSCHSLYQQHHLQQPMLGNSHFTSSSHNMAKSCASITSASHRPSESMSFTPLD